MKKRTKVTPRWLSIIRKFYAYLTGAGLVQITLHSEGWADSDILVFMGWWGALGMLVQFVCDVSYKKEPLIDMPADNPNPQLKS